MNTRNPRSLADFKGRWSLSRRIEHANGSEGRLEGHAVWRQHPEGLAYHETGVLQFAGHRDMQSERRYLWKPDWSVCFDDGRFFHTVPPEGGETSHWCDPDRYDVSYSFDDWPHFQVEWRVTGPRKSYCMRSIYCRV